MSALGKVFVVFIFVLSVVFFGTSATLFKTRTDWRDAYTKLNTETQKGLDAVRKRNDELLTRLSDMEKTNIGLKAQQDELAKGLKQMTEDLSAEKKSAAGHAANAAKANDVSTTLAKNLDSEKTRYSQLEESLNKVKTDYDAALAQRDKSDHERDSMRLDLEKSQQELHALKVQHHDLSGKFDSLQVSWERAKQLLGPNATTLATAGARPIDAMVTAVDPKEKLVVLSAGRDQKVEMGYEFTVYRGGDFIGKVKVIKVLPDLCGAEVIFTKEGAEIQQGDKASTSI